MPALIRKAYATHTDANPTTIVTAGTNGLQGNHLRVLNLAASVVTVTVTVLHQGSTEVTWDKQDVPVGGKYEFDGTLNLQNTDVLQVTAAAQCTTYFCAMEPV